MSIAFVGLFVSSPRAESQGFPFVRSLLDSVSADKLLSSVRSLEAAGGFLSRVNFTPGNDSARSFLLRSFASLPGMQVSLDAFRDTAQAPYNESALYNVASVLPGSHDTDAVVVVGAHYDSQAGRDSNWTRDWFTIHAPGADDNASGVAGVLEIARILANPDGGYRNRLPIHFVAFGAEEGTTPGIHAYLNGSRHYAQGLRQKGVKVVGFVNLDMIAYNPWTMVGTIVADSQSQWLGQKTYTLNDVYQVGLILSPPPYLANRWSDHAPFWDEGYPAILLIENFDVLKPNEFYPGNPNYHLPSDTSGALNPELMVSFCRLALATVAELAADSVTVTGLPRGGHVPETFTVAAYPNPFNPSVTIQIDLPRESEGRVEIADLLGRKVEELFSGNLQPGRHRWKWQAARAASGIYLARVVTGAGSKTIRLVLLR